MDTLGPIPERSSAIYITTIRDEWKVPVTAGDISDLTATLTLKTASGTVINSRNAQDVKNKNGVTFYGTVQTAPDGKTYNMMWTLSPADNAILGTGGAPQEIHYATFDLAWASGTKRVTHELTILVRNVPAISA